MNALTCLYEDQHLYVIHKPENIPFHSLTVPSQKDQTPQQIDGIVSLAKHYLKDEHIYPVHRLDKLTSGLMIFARTTEANRALSGLFQQKKIEKYYLAVSYQKPKKKQGAIIGDMAKGRSGSYMLKHSKQNPAITRFFATHIQALPKPAWLYTLKPETGKTHQLRVALKSLGSPVLGDKRYAGDTASRGYLHAYKLRFDLFGKRYDIIDPFFQGEEFSLETFQEELTKLPPSNNQDRLNLPSPECLAWPKSSFLLPVNAET